MRDSYGGGKFTSVVLILVPVGVAAYSYAVLSEHPCPVLAVGEEVPRRAASDPDPFAAFGYEALLVVSELGGLPANRAHVPQAFSPVRHGHRAAGGVVPVTPGRIIVRGPHDEQPVGRVVG